MHLITTPHRALLAALAAGVALAAAAPGPAAAEPPTTEPFRVQPSDGRCAQALALPVVGLHIAAVTDCADGIALQQFRYDAASRQFASVGDPDRCLSGQAPIALLQPCDPADPFQRWVTEDVDGLGTHLVTVEPRELDVDVRWLTLQDDGLIVEAGEREPANPRRQFRFLPLSGG